MNNTTVGLVSFTCGLGIGAFGMYISMTKKFEEELNAEIENIKVYYEDKVKEMIAEEMKNLDVSVQPVIEVVSDLHLNFPCRHASCYTG